MRNQFKLILAFLFITQTFVLHSQGVAIGDWRDHLPWNNCISVTEGNGMVYCATTYAVFSFDKSDNSIQRLTKVNMLSDIGVSRVAFHKGLNMLVVTYSNGNIDLIEGTTVTNISDIKRDPAPGLKSINNILFIGDYAYLSCGFGIVVLDLVRKEISDTYYIGALGAHINVLDMTCDGTNLYAATEAGIFEADINDPNLADYNAWFQHTEMPHPAAKYNAIVYFNNALYVNLSVDAFNSDTMYKFSNGAWNYFNLPTMSVNARKYNLRTYNNNLVVVNEGDVSLLDSNDSLYQVVYTYNPGTPSPRDAVMDTDNILWIADMHLGLVKNYNYGWSSQFAQPSGPSSANVIDMSVEGSNLWVAPGGYNDQWNNLYNLDGVFSFINEEWTTYNGVTNPIIDTIYDVVRVAVNPANPNQAFAGTWSGGLLEFDNQVLTKIYNESNSTLKGTIADITSSLYRLRIGGIAFDTLGNMWVTNSDVNTAINVRTSSGTWKAFDMSGFLDKNTIGSIVIDKNNYKWVILPRTNGLLVFNDNGTISNTSDDQVKKLSNAAGYGGLPSANVYSIAVDLTGEIWVGTDAGVGVFYSPENVFTGSNFDAQQILVNEGGFIQPLLQSEIVTAIAVDGANRKWIGTQKAGVFLMSADGTTQLAHFTVDNSPLFSNTINCIAIDGITGEVFFGTDKGIISFKGTATKGKETYTNVLVYPNPVSEAYTGTIGIRGLVADADVKITDITGTLIYKTKAYGGQAVWNGKNFNGDRAKTGVYLVFCSNADGSAKLVTKIMFIN